MFQIVVNFLMSAEAFLKVCRERLKIKEKNIRIEW